jgi:NADH:ubiquinone oxidoreductase subunit 5 (subunit L)/multisubunit Na+/H+ antiporter MnhA subunit/multisubunit Na+/H+ antiporter MnhB subunit
VIRPETILITAPAICLVGALIAALFDHPALARRLRPRSLGWLLSAAPAAAFVLLVSATLPGLSNNGAVETRLPWMPSLGVEAVFYFDALSSLFALLITAIGTLVVVYAGYYLEDDPGAPRFLAYLLLFMTSMLGLVLAGDIVTLFLFWEGTSVTSFLLIGYKTKDEEARRGAFKALLITGGGGIALLAGLLLAGYAAGSGDLAAMLASGEALRNSPLYLLILAMLGLAAFTKSAQVPFHVWLPDAMTAPTPASAFLHSATMVKAGLYLMARFNPVMGGTAEWFWLLSIGGIATMIVGAYLGFKQNDLKGLLAYTTVSQLGVLMMLLGQDISIAFKAFVIGVIAHGLYKSSLFLITGIVDHATGTRDLRRLGGIGHEFRFLTIVAAVAGFSMAGLPPLFGFLAKETLLATVVDPGVPAIAGQIFTALAVVAASLLVAQAMMFVWDTFLGRSRDPHIHPHKVPFGFMIAPAFPAVLSILLASLPEPRPFAVFLANAAERVYGTPVKVDLALWTGWHPEVFLSGLAVLIGFGLFFNRARVRAGQWALTERVRGFSLNGAYEGFLRLVDRLAFWATRTQTGSLRLYLIVMLLGSGFLMFFYNAIPADIPEPRLPPISMAGGLEVLRLFALLLAVAAAAASVVLQRDLMAVLALSASGLAVAVIFALEPAPDLALVQVVVDLLITIILILVLRRLPRALREQAYRLNPRNDPWKLARDFFISITGGIIMAAVVLTALNTRPRPSVVTPFFERNAKPLTGATDIVGAILLDFRAMDTMFEIAVFAMAGIGVYTLMRYALKQGQKKGQPETQEEPGHKSILLGIGGQRPSPFVRLLTDAILPLSMVFAVVHMMYGHAQPGDGFTAGVMVTLAVGLWHIVYGNQEARRRLTWLRPSPLIAGGLLLLVVNGVVASFITGHFLAPVDYGKMIGLQLPGEFHISSSFLFEVSIFLTVLGSASRMIDTLAYPEETAQIEGEGRPGVMFGKESES